MGGSLARYFRIFLGLMEYVIEQRKYDKIHDKDILEDFKDNQGYYYYELREYLRKRLEE